MSTVHKTIISVRSAVTGLNDEALSAFAEGEEAVVGLLERQKEALKDEIRVMRATADGNLG
jgi:limonene-1,2-epoxide hydrolase